LQSASRFESVLLAATKSCKHQHKRCSFSECSIPALPVFCWTSFACVCTCYASINAVLNFIFPFWYNFML
jgi:hypothetical protein